MPLNPTRKGTRTTLIGKLKLLIAPGRLVHLDCNQREATSFGRTNAPESLEKSVRVSDGSEEQRQISRRLGVRPDLDGDPIHQSTPNDSARTPSLDEISASYGELWRCLEAGLVSRDIRGCQRGGRMAGNSLSHFSRDLRRPLEPSKARDTSPNSEEADCFADPQADSNDLALRECRRLAPLPTSPVDEDRPTSSSRALSSTTPKPPSPSVALPGDGHLAHQFTPIPDRGAHASRATDGSPPTQASSNTSDPSSKDVVSNASAIVTWDGRCVAITLKNRQCKRHADGGSDVCWQHKGTSRKVTNSLTWVPQHHNESSTSSESTVTTTGTLGGRCVAITLRGKQCKRRADGGSDVCWQHKGTSWKVTNSQFGPPQPSNSYASSGGTGSTIGTFGYRCAAITLRGDQCKRRADGGSDVCWQHKATFRKVTNSLSLSLWGTAGTKY